MFHIIGNPPEKNGAEITFGEEQNWSGATLMINAWLDKLSVRFKSDTL